MQTTRLALLLTLAACNADSEKEAQSSGTTTLPSDDGDGDGGSGDGGSGDGGSGDGGSGDSGSGDGGTSSEWAAAYEALSNRWYKAPIEEVSETDGSRWQTGQPVPNLEMIDQNGDTVWLYQFSGKVVVVDFFGMWCGPCRDNVPDQEALWQEFGDDIIVVGLLETDNDFAPGGPEDVAEWMDSYAPTHPVVYLSAEERARLPDITSYPRISIIDPKMRLVIGAAHDYGDDWRSQMYDRMRLMAHGNLDNEEVCGDGWDNDMNGRADCMESACADACVEQRVEGSITPCFAPSEPLVWDVYRVEVPSETVKVALDTVNSENRFDVISMVRDASKPWVDETVLMDDEVECTHPLDTYGCGEGWLRPGTWEVAVMVGGSSVEGDCGDPTEGRYAFSVSGDATVTLTEDDAARQAAY